LAPAFIDTDVLIRLLTGDDPAKQAQSAVLFERVERGEIVLVAPDTVIADAVYVLSSPRLYHVPRRQVADMLLTLLRLPNLHIQNGRTVQAALELYGTSALDFGDALIIATMRESNSASLYSYDTDFDRIGGIARLEP
jgi:predicted nucleic acid-binding protein